MATAQTDEPEAAIASMDHQHIERHEDGAAGFLPERPQDYRLQAADIDAATEKRIRYKMDRVLIVLVFMMYLVSFLDRSNIGNAQTAGMSKDLGFSDDQYQVGAWQCWRNFN
jgi:hypothetical protein